jgi:hypothetical protein
MMADGTVNDPLPNHTTQVEPKVKYQAIAMYVVSAVLLFIFELATGNDNELLVAALPDIVESFVLPLVPTIGGLVVAFYTRHQWRRAEVPGDINQRLR